MRLIAPYAGRGHALKDRRAEYFDVGTRDEAYFDLLAELWEAAEDFCIVEHDIQVSGDTIDEFERCPQLWCCAPYPYQGDQLYQGLGCMRFRRELMLAEPDLLRVVGERSWADHPLKHWCIMDAGIQRSLWPLGHQPHPHSPVGHEHTTPSHGCC